MYIADLHVHSKYSRATSGTCDLRNLERWALKKGIGLIGTGDFTHPAWREEMRRELVQDRDGLYTLKESFRTEPADGERLSQTSLCGPDGKNRPRFVISGEISCIYKQDGKVRKVHNVILLPDPDAAETLAHRLEAIGNVHSDGRPILGLSSRDLLAITLEACPDAVLIPAHIWTPHFSMFGAFSGFERPEECFGDLTGCIHAVETGLSSDPPMNWRIPFLDRFTLVSNSDAHSPAKLGREANLIDAPLSFAGLKRALETGEGFCGTLEFFPEEGKYHLDGHRGCNLRVTPEQSRSYGGICPVCGKKLTIGVLNRVEQLAARPAGYRPESAKPFEHLMPLPELLADCEGAGPDSGRVRRLYEKLLCDLGPEFGILRTADLKDISLSAGPIAAEAVARLRAGKVRRQAGYDGEYGTVSLFAPGEVRKLRGQLSFLPGIDPIRPVGRPERPASVPVPAEKESAETVPDKTCAEKESAETDKAAAEKESAAAVRFSAGTELNDEQREAVRASGKAVAVVAGPGTGKTKTLVERAAYLIEECGVPASHVTAVTFTNRAADEMRERLADRLGGKSAAARMTIGTFHAICLLLLKQDRAGGVVLIDPSEALAVAEELKSLYGLKPSPVRLLQKISARKNGAPPDPETEEAYLAYCVKLRQLGAMDFDDLLREAIKREATHEKRFTHLLVDEFQDANDLQYRLLQKWGRGAESVFAIGDPDQSIYGFRGADADCFKRFAADNPGLKTVKLLRNYRSTPQILRCAEAVISHGKGERSPLTACRSAGTPVRVVTAESDLSEGIFLAKEIAALTGGLDMVAAHGAGTRREETRVRTFSDIAVLCRTHRHMLLLEKCLRRDGIPCLAGGRENYLSDEKVRGTLGFFRFLLDCRDAPSLRACLRCVWAVPEDKTVRALREAQRARSAAECAESLKDEPTLAEFARQTALFAPLLKKEKPRRLLNGFCGALGFDTPALDCLKSAAVFSSAMPDFLQNLLLGGESDLVRGEKKDFLSGAVRLTTLHGAKGLEFPVVFLCGVTAGAIPHESPRTPCDTEEERRLFYVGLTRAKEELIIVSPAPPSAFLDELPLGGYVRERARAGRPAEGKQISMF